MSCGRSKQSDACLSQGTGGRWPRPNAALGREEALREREEALKKRVSAKVDDQIRAARKEIDAIIDGLKASRRAAVAARQRATVPVGGGITTGETGAVRASARWRSTRSRRG